MYVYRYGVTIISLLIIVIILVITISIGYGFLKLFEFVITLEYLISCKSYKLNKKTLRIAFDITIGKAFLTFDGIIVYKKDDIRILKAKRRKIKG